MLARSRIAGDARHQTPLFQARACAGIRDAANLAWKLRWCCAPARATRCRQLRGERAACRGVDRFRHPGRRGDRRARRRQGARTGCRHARPAAQRPRRDHPPAPASRNLTIGVARCRLRCRRRHAVRPAARSAKRGGGAARRCGGAEFPAGDGGRGGAGVAFASVNRACGAHASAANVSRSGRAPTERPAAFADFQSVAACLPIGWRAMAPLPSSRARFATSTASRATGTS